MENSVKVFLWNEEIGILVWNKVEKPHEFDPRGQAMMTLASKKTLTPDGKI